MPEFTTQRLIQLPFGILSIKHPFTDSFTRNIISNCSYTKQISNDDFEFKYKIGNSQSDRVAYRQVQMAKGLYLNHHIGHLGHIEYGNKSQTIYIDSTNEEEFERHFWCYSLKFVLTYLALEHDSLHLKCTTLIKNGKASLILGRGGAGKTTLASFLEQNGYTIAGNTHCIVKDSYVWAINTHKRIRDKNSAEYYEFDNKLTQRDGYIDRVVLYNFSPNEFLISDIEKENVNKFISIFSAATSNYDLKEDLLDFKQCDFSEKIQWLNKEKQLVDAFIQRNNIFLMQADIYDENIAQLVLNFFNGE